MTYPSLQEDVPDEFANVMLNFVSRNRIGAHGVVPVWFFQDSKFFDCNIFVVPILSWEIVLVSVIWFYVVINVSSSVSCGFPDSRSPTTNHFEVCKLGWMNSSKAWLWTSATYMWVCYPFLAWWWVASLCCKTDSFGSNGQFLDLTVFWMLCNCHPTYQGLLCHTCQESYSLVRMKIRADRK